MERSNNDHNTAAHGPVHSGLSVKGSKCYYDSALFCPGRIKTVLFPLILGRKPLQHVLAPPPSHRPKSQHSSLTWTTATASSVTSLLPDTALQAPLSPWPPKWYLKIQSCAGHLALGEHLTKLSWRKIIALLKNILKGLNERRNRKPPML